MIEGLGLGLLRPTYQLKSNQKFVDRQIGSLFFYRRNQCELADVSHILSAYLESTIVRSFLSGPSMQNLDLIQTIGTFHVY